MPTYIDRVLGKGGLLEKKLPSYEPRPQQLTLARAIDEALQKGRSLDAEAPCGTGKTFAYLVPLIYHCLKGTKRGVICTANIALQEQLVSKDLPTLAKILPRPFTYSLVKGLGNYLCLDRFHETVDAPSQAVLFQGASRAPAKDLARIRAWVGRTKTGDRSDLDFEPQSSTWGQVCGVSDLCDGRECVFYKDCFAMEARKQLTKAQILVTNYHLFFAHLKIRIEADIEAIFPPYDFVICDEGHEMVDIARKFFGRHLTPRSFLYLLRGTSLLRRRDIADHLRKANTDLFEQVKLTLSGASSRRLTTPGWLDTGRMDKILKEHEQALVAAQLSADDEVFCNRVRKCATAARNFRGALRELADLSNNNAVYWIEREEEGATMRSQLLDVAPLLDEHLYKKVPSIIATSATLKVAGSFEFIKKQRGGAKAQEITVSSPFDFTKQCRLIIPQADGRGPNEEGFTQGVGEGIVSVLNLLGGRTMALFTSWHAMEQCARQAGSTGVKILCQGQRPRMKLLQDFKRDWRNAALFATTSFWQGVDIPGEALSCLVIDRLPFEPPDEPLVQMIRERDPRAFWNFSLPRAILMLRQGFGRLIRTKTDRGVVVLFDTRVVDKPYGRTILRSLPSCPVSRELTDVAAFLPTTSR